MTIIERIAADQQAIQAGVSQQETQAIVAANIAIHGTKLPSYSELVNTVLTWHRTSDQCKAVRHAAHLERRKRTEAEVQEVRHMEEKRRASTHLLNNLIDRLPRGI